MARLLDLTWALSSLADIEGISDYIGADNLDAAQALADYFELRAAKLQAHPRAYREGRLKGTREMSVHLNYLMVYAVSETTVTILRVLHAAQQWP